MGVYYSDCLQIWIHCDVSITKNNKGIDGDWRIHKENLEYNLIILPTDIENKCINLLEKLNLKFGCIDLIKHKEDYYFLEINPTGEWDWLMYNLELDIDIKISELLIGSIRWELLTKRIYIKFFLLYNYGKIIKNYRKIWIS